MTDRLSPSPPPSRMEVRTGLELERPMSANGSALLDGVEVMRGEEVGAQSRPYSLHAVAVVRSELAQQLMTEEESTDLHW